MSSHLKVQHFLFCRTLTFPHAVLSVIAHGWLKSKHDSLMCHLSTRLFVSHLSNGMWVMVKVLSQGSVGWVIIGQTSKASAQCISPRLLKVNGCHIHLSVCYAIWSFHRVASRGNKLTLFCRRQARKAGTSIEGFFRSFYDLERCYFTYSPLSACDYHMSKPLCLNGCISWWLWIIIVLQGHC